MFYVTGPPTCGEVKNEILTHSVGHIDDHNWYLTSNDIWKKHHQSHLPQHIWWSYPEPIFNTFYYG